MSNNDSFIDEVTEEVRKDRLYALFRRYGWIGVIVILGVVGGAAWTEWRKASAEAAAEAFGDRLIDAFASNEPAARLAALADVPAEGGQQTILALVTAAEAVAAGDSQRALGLLDPIAADQTLPVAYRHLALLKRVMIAGDTMPAADRDAALAELATAGAPFRLLAVEQQALALVQSGKPEEAVATLNRLLQEQGVTAALRRRATQLIVALGGEVQTG